MSLIRDKDLYYHIIGIFTVVSTLSDFVTIVLFWCCTFAACAERIMCIPLPRPHRFAVTGLVHCVRAIL